MKNKITILGLIILLALAGRVSNKVNSNHEFVLNNFKNLDEYLKSNTRGK